jgi:hypothetical protein
MSSFGFPLVSALLQAAAALPPTIVCILQADGKAQQPLQHCLPVVRSQRHWALQVLQVLQQHSSMLSGVLALFYSI